jgi:methyl-accepting chemotaxis protein
VLNIGSIAARITLDPSGYKRGIADAEQSNRSFGSSFSRFVLNPVTLGVGAVAAVGGGFAVYANRVLASAEATQRLAQRTGLSTDTVQALRAQLNLASGDGAKATEIFNAFAIRLGQARQGAGEAGPALAQLGLDVRQFANVDDALRAVLGSLSGVADPAQRAALAAKLLGEQGGPLLVQALEGTGTVEQLIARMRDFGQVIERDTIDKVASLNTTLGFAKLGFQGLLEVATAEFLAVFADESGRADEQLRAAFRTLKEDLIPAVKDLAEAIQTVSGGIDAVADSARAASDVVGTVVDANKQVATDVVNNNPAVVRNPFGYLESVGARTALGRIPGFSPELASDIGRRSIAR